MYAASQGAAWLPRAASPQEELQGPAGRDRGWSSQNQVPPSRPDIAVLSGAILGMSQGEQPGAGKGGRLRAQRVPGCSNLCNYRFTSTHRASVKDAALQCDPGSPIPP